MPSRAPSAAPRSRCTLRRALREGREAGSFSLEAAILMVAVLALVFGAIQGALWFHARNVASSAAQVAVQTARAYDSSAGAGQTAGLAYLTNVGGIDNPSVAVTRGAIATTATVHGTTSSLVPGIPLPAIRVHAEAATERLTP